MPASFIAAFTASATFSTIAGRPMSSGRSSALMAVPMASRDLDDGPVRPLRAKIVACGVITPSQPPDQTMGIKAISSPPRDPCRSSTRRKAWSARMRVKSLTPPLPSVLPMTAITSSAVNCLALMQSSSPLASWTVFSSTFATSIAMRRHLPNTVSACAARTRGTGLSPACGCQVQGIDDAVMNSLVSTLARTWLIGRSCRFIGSAATAAYHCEAADKSSDVVVSRAAANGTITTERPTRSREDVVSTAANKSVRGDEPEDKVAEEAATYDIKLGFVEHADRKLRLFCVPHAHSHPPIDVARIATPLRHRTIEMGSVPYGTAHVTDSGAGGPIQDGASTLPGGQPKINARGSVRELAITSRSTRARSMTLLSIRFCSSRDLVCKLVWRLRMRRVQLCRAQCEIPGLMDLRLHGH